MRTNVIALPSDQGNDAVQLYLLQHNTYPLPLRYLTLNAVIPSEVVDIISITEVLFGFWSQIHNRLYFLRGSFSIF
jgi:hypothetical protein